MSQEALFVAFYQVWLPWTAVGVIALLSVVGLLALMSPRWFTTVTSVSAIWIDTNSLLKKSEMPAVNLDRYALQHSRLFGAAVLIWASMIAYVFPRPVPYPWALWFCWASVASLGVVALVAPPLFERMTQFANTWVDTTWLTDLLDRRYDVDHHAIQYRHTLGAVLLAGASSIGYLSFC